MVVMETQHQAITVKVGGENILTIPNVLSGYRLLISPFILWLIIDRNESLFAVFICISLVTDMLDGIIARVFKMATRFGARLDSLADIGMYVLAIYGGIVFKWDEIRPDAWMLFLFLGTYVTAQAYSLWKFRSYPSLHLYSCKTGGYLQGVFFFVLFAHAYVPWLYFLAVGWGVLSYVEELLVLMALPEMRSNVRGLYWVLKS